MRSKDACELGGPSHEIDPVFQSSQITSIFDNDIPFREIPKRSSLNGEVDESVARGCSTNLHYGRYRVLVASSILSPRAFPTSTEPHKVSNQSHSTGTGIADDHDAHLALLHAIPS
jgi:hypothetical protein